MVTETGCHECTSHAPAGNGYPGFRRDGKYHNIHRYLFELIHGPLGKLVARHTCDNRICINTDHIEPGTQTENQKDIDERGRRVLNSKRLTAADAKEIKQSSLSSSVLAQRFGVVERTIRQIRAGETWRNI